MTTEARTQMPVSVQRPVFDAAEQIMRLIVDAKLAPGDALPSEAELGARLGISRGSLREAVKALQAKGIIDVFHGRGMFVGHLSMDALIDGLVFHTRIAATRDHRRAASDLVDVRDILERSLVQQVAVAADPAVVAELEVIVEQMERSDAETPPFQELDRRFHSILYTSTGNDLVVKLIRAFWDVLDAARPDLPPSRDDRSADAAHHRAILEAVRAGDAEAAERAMKLHFRDTHRWIQRSVTAP